MRKATRARARFNFRINIWYSTGTVGANLKIQDRTTCGDRDFLHRLHSGARASLLATRYVVYMGHRRRCWLTIEIIITNQAHLVISSSTLIKADMVRERPRYTRLSDSKSGHCRAR